MAAMGLLAAQERNGQKEIFLIVGYRCPIDFPVVYTLFLPPATRGSSTSRSMVVAVQLDEVQLRRVSENCRALLSYIQRVVACLAHQSFTFAASREYGPGEKNTAGLCVCIRLTGKSRRFTRERHSRW